jgi:hypothetical protein
MRSSDMSSKITVTDEMIEFFRNYLETSYVKDESYTLYGVSTILNAILVKDGKSEIRSQMMYNYGRNGLIVPKERISGVNLRKVTKDEVISFVVRYCVRNSVNIIVQDEMSEDVPVQDDTSVDVTVTDEVTA